MDSGRPWSLLGSPQKSEVVRNPRTNFWRSEHLASNQRAGFDSTILSSKKWWCHDWPPSQFNVDVQGNIDHSHLGRWFGGVPPEVHTPFGPFRAICLPSSSHLHCSKDLQAQPGPMAFGGLRCRPWAPCHFLIHWDRYNYQEAKNIRGKVAVGIKSLSMASCLYKQLGKSNSPPRNEI